MFYQLPPPPPPPPPPEPPPENPDPPPPALEIVDEVVVFNVFRFEAKLVAEKFASIAPSAQVGGGILSEANC